MFPRDLSPEVGGDVRSALHSSEVQPLSHEPRGEQDHQWDTLPGICPQDLAEIMLPPTSARLATDGFTSNYLSHKHLPSSVHLSGSWSPVHK